MLTNFPFSLLQVEEKIIVIFAIRWQFGNLTVLHTCQCVICSSIFVNYLSSVSVFELHPAYAKQKLRIINIYGISSIMNSVQNVFHRVIALWYGTSQSTVVHDLVHHDTSRPPPLSSFSQTSLAGHCHVFTRADNPLVGWLIGLLLWALLGCLGNSAPCQGDLAFSHSL